jgi:hypothetical protein
MNIQPTPLGLTGRRPGHDAAHAPRQDGPTGRAVQAAQHWRQHDQNRRDMVII